MRKFIILLLTTHLLPNVSLQDHFKYLKDTSFFYKQNVELINSINRDLSYIQTSRFSEIKNQFQKIYVKPIVPADLSGTFGVLQKIRMLRLITKFNNIVKRNLKDVFSLDPLFLGLGGNVLNELNNTDDILKSLNKSYKDIKDNKLLIVRLRYYMVLCNLLMLNERSIMFFENMLGINLSSIEKTKRFVLYMSLIALGAYLLNNYNEKHENEEILKRKQLKSFIKEEIKESASIYFQFYENQIYKRLSELTIHNFKKYIESYFPDELSSKLDNVDSHELRLSVQEKKSNNLERRLKNIEIHKFKNNSCFF